MSDVLGDVRENVEYANSSIPNILLARNIFKENRLVQLGDYFRASVLCKG